MGFLHRFSRLRIFLDASKCNRCGVCDTSCDVGAIEKGVIRISNCQFCHACVDHCSTSALKVVDVWAIRASKETELPKAKGSLPSESPSA